MLCFVMIAGLVPTMVFAESEGLHITKKPVNITLAPSESKGVSMIFEHRVLGGTDFGNAYITDPSGKLINFGANAGVEVTPHTFSYDVTKAGTTETYRVIHTCSHSSDNGFYPEDEYSFTVTYLEATAPTTHTVTFDSDDGSAVTAQAAIKEL